MIKLQRIHLMSKTKMLKPLRHFIDDFLHQENHLNNKKNIEDLIMAVNEACMNVIQHAYKNRPNEEIIIEFWQDQQDVLVKIFDDADCVDISSIKSRDLDDVRPGGLGVHMIHDLMDCVEYKNNPSKKGNVLEMRKKIL